jgi:hypothetical protein
MCTHFTIDASGDATQEAMERTMCEMSWSRDDLLISSLVPSKCSCSTASNFLRCIPTFDNGRECAVYVDTLYQDVSKHNGCVDFPPLRWMVDHPRSLHNAGSSCLQAVTCPSTQSNTRSFSVAREEAAALRRYPSRDCLHRSSRHR